MKRADPGRSRPGRQIGRWLSHLALIAIPGSFVGLVLYRDSVEGERRRREEEAQAASRSAVLARGNLADSLALCAEEWKNLLSFYYEPVALAWTRQGIDALFYEGVDKASLRRVRCDARGVTRGPRVPHPLHQGLPAEAPATPGEVDYGRWSAAVGDASSRSLGEGEVAFEMVLHPVTGEVLARSWRAGAEGATAVLEPPGAPAFGLVLSSPDFRPIPAGSAPLLKPMPRRRWLAEADAAFDLLQRELPRGAPVSELTLTDDAIDVQIAWPTPAFEGKPDAPFGDQEWDEYGVAESSWWYPREIAGFGCARGETVARLRASFAEARERLGARPLVRAWYSCSPAYSDGRVGVWNLVAR